MPRETKGDVIERLEVGSPPEELAALKAIAARHRELRQKESRLAALDYYNSPSLWARDNICWGNGQGPAAYQTDIFEQLPIRRRACVRSPHGAGKTMTAALVCLWFATTREQMGVDWKIITTASNWNQLTHYLWPEIHKWVRALNWKKLGLAKWTRGQNILGMTLKGEFGEAFGMSPADPSGIEGAHATELLYVFDEAKAIPTGIFDAAEGAFSTAGTESGTNAYALAISTPGEPAGRFWDIQNRAPGTEDWWARHITLQEAMDAGRVTQEWVEQRRLMWGETSAVYRNRVMGEFAADAADSVVPLAWVEQANERWRRKYEMPDGKVKGIVRTVHQGTPAVLSPGETVHILGVDVAGAGEDKSVIAFRQANTIPEIRRFPYTDDLMELANIVTGLQANHKGPKAIVDANGIGAGVADRLRELKQPCQSFVGQAGIHRRDATGDFAMANCRSWAWWNLREMLTPHSGCDVALPPDDRLTGDLTSVKWSVAAGGRIVVETKKDIRKRIGRSPDDGDAVAMAFFTYGQSWASLYLPPDPDAIATPFGTPTGVSRRAGSFADLFKSPEQIEQERIVKRVARGEKVESGESGESGDSDEEDRVEALPPPRQQHGWYGGRQGSWFSSTPGSTSRP